MQYKNFRKKRFERKKRIIFVLSCIVTFLTVYSLVLPAITIDKETADEDNGIVLNDNRFIDTKQQGEEADNTAETISSLENKTEVTIENGASINEETEYPSVIFSDSINDTLVHVSAPEGAFPKGTVMTLKEVENEEVSASVGEVINNNKIISYKAIDITFVYNDEKIEPRIPIEVSMTSNFISEDSKDPLLVHIDDEGKTDVLKAKKPEEDLVETISENSVVKKLIENNNDIDEITIDNTLTFESDSFSVYVLVYTVHFEYEVNGETFDTEIPGGQNILLSDVLGGLNIVEEDQFNEFITRIADVKASDPEVLIVSSVEHDWTIRPVRNSEKPESLTVFMQDGSSFTVTVEANGITELSDENDIATISTINDVFLPEDAVINAQILSDSESKQIIDTIKNANVNDDSYQAFHVDLENAVDREYEGFKVSINLPEDSVTGKDFKLYQIKDEKTVDLTDSLELYGEINDNGTQSVGEISFIADSLTDYVLSYSINTFYTSFDGNTYKISMEYGSKAGIPEGSELKVKEVLENETVYEQFLSDSASLLGIENKDIQSARFFDIEIIKNGTKIEPQDQVWVNISLSDPIYDVEENDLKVIHFGNSETEPIEIRHAGFEENSITLGFTTESFSVYGVITVPAPSSVNNLGAYSVKISNLGYYLGAENIMVGDSRRLSKTNSEVEAPLWTFESTNTTGQYYVSTVTAEGKQYINIKRSTDQRGDVFLSNEPQALTVVQNGNNYRISGTDNGGTYFINQFDNTSGIGFAGWWYNGSVEAQLNFTFVPPTTGNGEKEYMVVVKQGDLYYVVLNDGTLSPAQYSAENNTVSVDDPMMWKYDGQRLYHVTREAGFTGDDIPSDNYYRYIDANSISGLSEDDETNTTATGDLVNRRDVHITSRSLWNAVNFIYTDHKLQSASNSNFYIGVDEHGHLKGQTSADDAVEVFLADPLVQGSDWKRHSVGHIDISINGTAEADVPLAYGKYYDENGNVVKEVKQNQFERLHLTKAQVVNQEDLSITPADMKRSRITAVCNGEVLDNAFYITGYSGNAEHGGHSGDDTDYITSPQVRIEGSFLVANMPSDHAIINEELYDSNQNYRNSIREEHLTNQVEYNISVAKAVEFYLQIPVLDDDGEQITDGDGNPVYQQLYDADGNRLKIKVDLAFSDSFTYWDNDNECPVFTDADKWYYYKNFGPHDGWSADDLMSGDVARCGFSGMDFKLGGNGSQSNTRVYAIEITKIVVDEHGNRIKSDNIGTTKFNIYRKSVETIPSVHDSSGNEYLDVVSANSDEVKDLNVGSFVSDELYLTGYEFIRNKTIQVGNDGVGLVYDYDVTPALYYIEEDPDSVAESITDANGKQWNYKQSYIWTEYAWRNHSNDNYMHIGQTYTNIPTTGGYKGVPEILGNHYGYNGSDGPFTNDFLEFYVYNVYESPKVDVPVVKGWDDFKDDQFDWEVSFKLQWAPLYPNETAPSTSFLDVMPVQTMTISKADMNGITQELVDRYLSNDDSLTPEEIEKIEAISFKNLPKYGTDSNGNTFRYQYSLQETSYQVTNSTTGVILYSWSEENGYNDPDEDTHYQPFYPHDAGEVDENKSTAENEADTNYYIQVNNAKRNISDKNYIDVSLDKQWDSSFAERNNSYWAEFELRRFVHTEYRDISHMSDSDRTAQPITITIKNGETIVHQLQVQPNVGLYLGGNFKPHDTAKSVTFTSDHPVRLGNDSRVTTLTASVEGENMSNAIVRTPEFFATQDTVFTISEGIDNLVVGNLARVLDTGAGTSPLPDNSFVQTIRLDNTNYWHVDLNDLIRSITSAGDDDDNENVTFYEYYFVEKGSFPKGYAQYFRADNQGNPSEILSGDSDHQIEHDDHIIALNGPSNRLIVKKIWRGVPDTTGFPKITFTLYQGWADGSRVSGNSGDSWIYVDDNGVEYKNIELGGNSFEWISPHTLPETKLDSNGVSRRVGYYVIEDEQSGSHTTGEYTTSWSFYYYLSSNGNRTNSYSQGFYAGITGEYLSEYGGTLNICNQLNTYVPLLINKKFFELGAAGSWADTTTSAERMANTVLGIKIIRAVKTSDGKYIDEKGQPANERVWMDYGDEMLIGYGATPADVLIDNGTNDFHLEDAGGEWHFRIKDNKEPGGGPNEQVGLPKYGFYILNGENVAVEYEYSYRETSVYKDLNRTAYPEWDWFSSVVPMELNPIYHGRIENAIANFQASDLIIEKEWIGEDRPNVNAVYVKVWRSDEDGQLEDFTATIANDIRNNHNWQNYVNDENLIDLNKNCLIIATGEDGSGSTSLKVNRALIASVSESSNAAKEYYYYIQEVGYKDASGYHTNVGKFKPLYDKWVGSAGDYTHAPAGMNDYAGMNIKIGAKGENRLKVINSTEPSTSYTVTKAFHGPQSSTGGQSSVTGKYPTDGSKQVVVELQQRYRYEKTEDGIDYVSSDNETWVRADSEDAKNTWTVDWQGAESASPTSVVLPLDKPEGSVLSDEAWYGSPAAWTFTWEGLDVKKVVSQDADPHKSKIAQLYYRAVEVSTPGWFNSVIAADEQDGHKAIDDNDQTASGILIEKNTVTNERNDCNLELNKIWTGLGEGKAWPDGVTIDYQLIQHFHLALADMNKGGDGHIVPTYSEGKAFKSVDMKTNPDDAATADSVHTQAIGRNVGVPSDGSTKIADITGLPVYGFLTATAEDVAEAAEAGITLTEGVVYPVVYTYSVKETDVKKNGASVAFKEQTVAAEKVETEDDTIKYSAVLTNELVSATVEKVWNGLTPGSDETATIQLRRFKKDIEPEPETTFTYTVTVVGNVEVLNSEGTVTVTIFDEENTEAGSYELKKNDWTHGFELEIGETYRAEFSGDGRIIAAEVVPSSVLSITEEGSINLTASLKPINSGRVKVIVTGNPSNLWMGPLRDSSGTELSPQKKFTEYFNGSGGETAELDGLTPGIQYNFGIGAVPSSVEEAEYNNGYVTFTAVDGLHVITLNYDSGGGESEEDNITITASVSSWISWPAGGNPYYMNYNTGIPPRSGSITVQIKGSYSNIAGELVLSPDNNWTATAEINQKNLSGYASGERISGAGCIYENPIEGADATYNNGYVSVIGKYPESAASSSDSFVNSPALRMASAKAPLRAPISISWTNNTDSLPAGADPTLDDVIDSVTLSNTSGWSKTWTELPKYSDDGKEYVYYAYETDYSGADGATSLETTYSKDANGNWIVTNTPTYPQSGNLKVTKQVLYGEEVNPDADDRLFTVGLFTDATGKTRVDGQLDKTITVKNGTGEVTFANLPAGTYYVFEIANGSPLIENGTAAKIDEFEYTVTYSSIEGTVVSSGSTSEFIVSNTQKEYDLNIIKVNEEDNEKGLDGAEFTLFKLKENESGSISHDGDGISKTTANGGKVSFEELSLGYYEIKETKTPAGYIIIGSDTFYIQVSGSGVQHVERSEDQWVPVTGKKDGVTFNAEEITATVENTPGKELPHTGGNGVQIYVITGLLMTGLSLLFLSKKKRHLI